MTDCTPVIGQASAASNAFHAFGHGHIGFTTAPRTARIVADLLAGRAPQTPMQAFSPRRFRR